MKKKMARRCLLRCSTSVWPFASVPLHLRLKGRQSVPCGTGHQSYSWIASPFCHCFFLAASSTKALLCHCYSAPSMNFAAASLQILTYLYHLCPCRGYAVAVHEQNDLSL